MSGSDERRQGDVPRPGRRQPGVEQQLARLASSIQPTSRHRDRTLRQASEAEGEFRGKVRSAQLVVGVSVALLIVSPLIGAITRVDAPPPQNARHANEQAIQYAEQQGTSLDWGLVDVFERFRQSKRLHR